MWSIMMWSEDVNIAYGGRRSVAAGARCVGVRGIDFWREKRYGDEKKIWREKDTERRMKDMAGKKDTDRRTKIWRERKDMAGAQHQQPTPINTMLTSPPWPPKP